jgi:DNA polymerase III epsilon subunit-like protein
MAMNTPGAAATAALPPPDIYVAFDVEATGMYMAGFGAVQENAMVELGACAMVANDSQRTVLDTFDRMMGIPYGCGWEPRCVDEFWSVAEGMPEKKERIDACQASPVDAMCAFVHWVESLVARYADGDSKRIVFVTDNAAFDAAWVSLYLARYAGHQPLHTFFGAYRGVLDTSSYAAGAARHTPAHKERFLRETGAKRYRSKDAVRAALGVPSSVRPRAVHDHAAVNDAQHLLEEHMIAEQHLPPACTD